MSKTIRAYTGWNEERRQKYYTIFDIIDKKPEVGETMTNDDYELIYINEVKEVWLDTEQGSDEVYNYNYYQVICEETTEDGEKVTFNYYVAVKINNNEYDNNNEF